MKREKTSQSKGPLEGASRAHPFAFPIKFYLNGNLHIWLQSKIHALCDRLSPAYFKHIIMKTRATFCPTVSQFPRKREKDTNLPIWPPKLLLSHFQALLSEVFSRKQGFKKEWDEET
jgi:hypothetical protein